MKAASFSIAGLIILLVCSPAFGDDSSAFECSAAQAGERCYLSSKELSAWRGDKQTVIVDTRPKPEYKKLHIPSSFNYPLYSLKTKEFLKKKRVLIVGKAYQRAALEHACLSLQKQRFENVRVLKGGLLSWKQSGGELSGDAAEESRLRQLMPQELFQEFYNSSWLLVDVSTTSSSLKGLEDAEYLSVPFEGAVVEFKNTLTAQIHKRQAKDPELLVAVFSDEASSQRTFQLESIISEMPSTSVFLVAGGRAAIEAYIEANSKVLAHLKRKRSTAQCR